MMFTPLFFVRHTYLKGLLVMGLLLMIKGSTVSLPVNRASVTIFLFAALT